MILTIAIPEVYERQKRVITSRRVYPTERLVSGGEPAIQILDFRKGGFERLLFPIAAAQRLLGERLVTARSGHSGTMLSNVAL